MGPVPKNTEQGISITETGRRDSPSLSRPVPTWRVAWIADEAGGVRGPPARERMPVETPFKRPQPPPFTQTMRVKFARRGRPPLTPFGGAAYIPRSLPCFLSSHAARRTGPYRPCCRTATLRRGVDERCNRIPRTVACCARLPTGSRRSPVIACRGFVERGCGSGFSRLLSCVSWD